MREYLTNAVAFILFLGEFSTFGTTCTTSLLFCEDLYGVDRFQSYTR